MTEIKPEQYQSPLTFIERFEQLVDQYGPLSKDSLEAKPGYRNSFRELLGGADSADLENLAYVIMGADNTLNNIVEARKKVRELRDLAYK